MIAVLIYLIVLLLVAWLVFILLDRLAVPELIRTVILVVFILICIVLLLQTIGVPMAPRSHLT
jgi:hypothetical protein